MSSSRARAQDEHSIQLRGVTKAFGPVVAVDRLTFNVQKGEVVGFLGPNGAGKTTTMRLLTGYYTPDEGRIFVNGIDIQEDDRAAKRAIGYLPESNPLYGDMLVHEYLAFIADLRGLSQSERRGRLETAVDESGVAAVYYRPINQISKGNRQRVGLAQCILHEPEVLIMDEPTEGLDPNQRLVIRDLIRSLGSDRTVLLSTHVLSEVEATCDRVIMINEGRLVVDDSVQNLLARTQGATSVHLEVQGEGVMQAVRRLSGVRGVQSLSPIDDRQVYVISVSGERDVRPDIFNLAKGHDWVLWELHEESTHLEDIFQSLTREPVEKDG